MYRRLRVAGFFRLVVIGLWNPPPGFSGVNDPLESVCVYGVSSNIVRGPQPSVKSEVR